ncbi:MAG: hypothetical protein HKP27_11535 [Myxococcales bacterium]|nr:hypothetical protein [Myxococcales bacterium]
MNDHQQRYETAENPQWADFMVGLYDRLTGRQAEICYELSDFEVQVPSEAGPNASYAPWRINGTLKIRTRDNSS